MKLLHCIPKHRESKGLVNLKSLDLNQGLHEFSFSALDLSAELESFVVHTQLIGREQESPPKK